MNLHLPRPDYDGYIFDCDGTLADSMPLHYVAWQKALLEYGTTLHFAEDEFYHLGGMSARTIIDLFNEREGTSYDSHELANFKEETYLQILPQVQPIEPVVELAKKFHTEGKPLAVASGGLRPIVEQTLRILGIRELFRVVVTPEDVLRGKPAPDLFLLAADRLGMRADQCLVFEDTPTGVAAAQAAGMDYVLVHSRGAGRATTPSSAQAVPSPSPASRPG